MLPLFQAVGLEPFLTLNEPICPRFVVKFYHSLEVNRDEEQRPYIEFKLGQFTFKLTSSQLSRIIQTPYALETFYTSKWSLNSLDDHPNSNLFGPKHYLVKNTITTPITTQTQILRDSNKLYLDEICPELKGLELLFWENFFCSLGKRNKVNACTVYTLYYLTIKRKFNFTLMLIYQIEEVKNKQDGPMPFTMLLTHLYNHILQINPQAIVPPTSEEKSNERTLSPPPRKKSLSLLQAPSKSISSKSIHYTSSSSPNESLTPTHVAPSPKPRFVILMKQEPQELPLLQISPNTPYVSMMDNWPLGPSNSSPPSHDSRPHPDFLNLLPEFEPLLSTQLLFVNINNNTPQLHNNALHLKTFTIHPQILEIKIFPILQTSWILFIQTTCLTSTTCFANVVAPQGMKPKCSQTVSTTCSHTFDTTSALHHTHLTFCISRMAISPHPSDYI
nr:hypothetical protein [Tanacetum cinerariifolium]